MSVVLWGARRGDRQFGSRSDRLMEQMKRDMATVRSAVVAALTRASEDRP